MSSIIRHRPHLGRGAERIRDAAGGVVIIGRERDADMAIVENGVVRSVGLFNLVERSEEHTSELQSLLRISYDVLCLKKKTEQFLNLQSATTSQTLRRPRRSTLDSHNKTKHRT